MGVFTFDFLPRTKGHHTIISSVTFFSFFFDQLHMCAWFTSSPQFLSCCSYTYVRVYDRTPSYIWCKMRRRRRCRGFVCCKNVGRHFIDMFFRKTHPPHTLYERIIGHFIIILFCHKQPSTCFFVSVSFFFFFFF